MTKNMKQHLETVVNSIVNEDAEAATAAFHEYLRLKTQSILLGESDDNDEDDEDDGEDKDEDDETDEKKEDKKSKKSKKSDDKDDADDK